MVGKARSGDVVILGGVAELSPEGGHRHVEDLVGPYRSCRKRRS